MRRQLVSAYGAGTLLSPLAHSEEVLGNKAFFRRLSIRSGSEILPVPVLSGNSFRGRWRDLLAQHLVETLGITRLSAVSFVTFFSGGSLTDGRSALADALYASFPSLSLLGFSMGGRMFASRVGVDFAVPLTDETRQYVTDAYPDLVVPAQTVSVNAITGSTMMTRKDDGSKAPLINLELDQSDEDPNPTQMIYYVEYIVPGTELVHGFRTTYPVSDLELGALITVLELAGQRTFGGMGSKGFGRVAWTYTLSLRPSLNEPPGPPLTLRLGEKPDIPPALAGYREQYEQHLSGLRTRIQADQDLAPVIQFAEGENE
jgi:hypothetical protein